MTVQLTKQPAASWQEQQPALQQQRLGKLKNSMLKDLPTRAFNSARIPSCKYTPTLAGAPPAASALMPPSRSSASSPQDVAADPAPKIPKEPSVRLHRAALLIGLRTAALHDLEDRLRRPVDRVIGTCEIAFKTGRRVERLRQPRMRCRLREFVAVGG